MSYILCNNPWEGLCFMMRKALLREKLEVETSNIRDDPKFFKKHKVQTCPVLLIFDGKVVVNRIKGVEDIIKFLKEDVQNREVSMGTEE